MKIITNNEKETIQLGEKIAKKLGAGDILCLSGNLGSGKTTFVKGLAKGFKISPKKVNSPTFVLMNIYEGKLPLYHFDLYRLENIKEILGIGYDEFFYGQGIAIIEWAEKLNELMPKEYLNIELKHKDQEVREIKIKPKGKHYKQLIDQL